MAKNIEIKFDADQMRRDGWSDAAIAEEREWIAHLNENLNRQESEEESEEESEQELDIAVLPDNDVRVPLDVLKSRREQLESLHYTYGDDSTFNQICNITGIINAREEELRRDYE